MTTNIAGHYLTHAEARVLDEVLDYLRKYAGDSESDLSIFSPKGDGRWISLLEIFPRSVQGTSDRRIVRRLANAGVLAACEVEYRGECVKLSPWRSVQPEDASQ